MSGNITARMVPVEEYLSTSYQPDRNYIDGRLEERNVGSPEHGDLTWYLRYLLRGLKLRVFTETRLRVAPSRYRVPDVCACTNDPCENRVLTKTPLLVAEVLSPEDRLEQTAREAQDYLAMGTSAVWILDPEDKTAYTVNPSRGLIQVHEEIAVFDEASKLMHSLKLETIFAENAA